MVVQSEAASTSDSELIVPVQRLPIFPADAPAAKNAAAAAMVLAVKCIAGGDFYFLACGMRMETVANAKYLYAPRKHSPHETPKNPLLGATGISGPAGAVVPTSPIREEPLFAEHSGSHVYTSKECRREEPRLHRSDVLIGKTSR